MVKAKKTLTVSGKLEVPKVSIFGRVSRGVQRVVVQPIQRSIAERKERVSEEKSIFQTEFKKEKKKAIRGRARREARRRFGPPQKMQPRKIFDPITGEEIVVGKNKSQKFIQSETKDFFNI